MNSDESPRNTQYSQNRKPYPPKPQVYSPSSSYNYNGSQGQHGGGSHGSHGNQNYGSQQHQQRRKPMPFKRDNNYGAMDKLSKQNDIIIRLLKEIRDRLPAPPASVVVEQQEAEQQLDAAFPAQEAPAEVAVAAEQDEHDDVQPQLEAAPAPVHADVDDDELDRQANGNL
jgi:hypothetical protein